MRPRLTVFRVLLVAVAAALPATALIGAATADGRTEILVGRYTGQTSQGKKVEFRLVREGDKLVIASFTGALDHCGGSSTFGTRDNTVIPADGRVTLRALGGDVTISIIVGGPTSVGRIDYSMAGCSANVRFSADLQPPDDIAETGRYRGVFHSDTYELTVVKKRGYFEATDFTGVATNCQGKKLGIDVSPDAFIDEAGKAEFTALSGRVKVELRFHHQRQAEGRVTYSEGNCSEEVTFAVRHNPDA